MARTTSELNILVKLRDQASAQMKRLSFSFDKAVEASRKVALGLAAAGGAVGGLGLMAIRAAGDLEQMKIGFETMLGSAEKADQFTRDLINFAKTTPFELTGLRQAASQLLAYGFAQEEVLPNLKALGDIASGVGMEKLPNLILAFGQVKAATRLTGMELRQFTEAGVPLLDELSKQLGVAAKDVQDMVSKGEIGFDKVKKALVDVTSEGGRFNNLMDKQSKSLGGMVSNLKDAWDIFLTGEGQKLLDWAKQFVALAIDIVQTRLPEWITRIEEMIGWLKENKEILIIISGAIMGALVPSIMAAVKAYAILAFNLAPFILGGALVAGIVAGIIWIVKNWEMISTKAQEIWQKIKDSIMQAIQPAIDFLTEKWNQIREFTKQVWDTMTSIIKTAINFWVGLIVSILDFLFPTWREKLGLLVEVLRKTWDAIHDSTTFIFGAAVDFIKTMLFIISETWQGVWGSVRDFFVGIWDGIKEKLEIVVNFIKDKVNELQRFVDNITGKLSAPLEKVKGLVQNTLSGAGNLFNKITAKGAEITGLARGGIVTRPTLATVAENEPEAVIPLSKFPVLAGAGAGTVINVNLSGSFFTERENALRWADQIALEIKRRIKVS